MSITLCLADVQRQRNESMNIDIVFDICNLALLQSGKLFPSVVCKASRVQRYAFFSRKSYNIQFLTNIFRGKSVFI